MSESITHTAVTDDCVRLALHSMSICEPFKLCMRQHLDLLRLGGVTRSGGNYMVQLVTRYRDAWPDRRPSDRIEEKLAFVLGWHTHRAADLQMKPIFEAVDKDCPIFPTDCSLYHDVYLFREVYGSGREEPYSAGTLEPQMAPLPGAKAFQINDGESLLGSVWQQRILGLHTFAEGQPKDENWIKRLLATRQTIRVDLERYCDAFRQPDPGKMNRFIHDINFYDRNDSIIRIARLIQHDGDLSEAPNLQSAVAGARVQSQYAQALRKGYLYLTAASDFFTRRIEADAYKDVLERAKQGIK